MSMVLVLLTTSALAAPGTVDLARTPKEGMSEEMLFADDPREWARPRAVLPPTYPPAAEAKGDVAKLDFTLSIDELGLVTAARAAKPGDAPSFEEAVLAVVKHWRFNPRLTKDCRPVPSEANVRVWFEIRDGKGVVSVSGHAGYHETQPAAGTAPRRSKWTNRRAIVTGMRYPFTAMRDGAEAILYAAIHVEAAKGTVKQVDVTWIKVFGKSEDAEASFSEAATWRLKSSTFEPESGPDYKTCVPVVFKFR